MFLAAKYAAIFSNILLLQASNLFAILWRMNS